MEPEASNAAESRHTAVVFTDPSLGEPAELLGALTGRGIDAVLVGDRYMAAAEVCRLYRARGGGTGAAPSGAMLALVIVNPEAQAGSCQLCEAVARYAGGTRCWMFGPAGSPRLRPIHDGDLALWSGVATEPTPKAAVRPGEEQRREPGPLLKAGDPGRKGPVSGPQLRRGGTVSETPAPAARASERNPDSGNGG